jgi:hypothetical protein
MAVAIPDDRLRELLDLIHDADSVELKLTVPETDHYATAAALGLDPLEAQIRQVFFFDTPDLDLNRQGVVVRARRIQRHGGDGDCVVKLRPVVPAEMPASLRASADFNVEVDAMPGGFVCSGTLKSRVDPGDVRAVHLGERPLKKLFSKQQRAFLGEHAPGGPGFSDLSLLGPVLVLKLKYQPDDYPRPLVVELWLFPDNSRVVELSTKCAPAEAFQVAAETRAYLTGRGVDLSGDQEAKTRKALEFFAARVRERA